MPKTSKESSDVAAAKQKLRKLFANPQFTSLLWNYAVGELVEKVHSIKDGRKHGTSAMQTLAKQVQPGGTKNLPGHLTQTRKFVATYTKAEVAAIVRRNDSKRRALGWQRMARLLSEPDAKKRAALLEKALANAWTVRRLQQELQMRHGGKRSWGGRRPTVPKSLPVLLGQLTRLCEQWEHWAEALGLADRDAEVVPGAKKLTPAVRSQFVVTLGHVRRLQAALEGQAERSSDK